MYSTICLPITNARWAERWRRMCLSSSSDRKKNKEKEKEREKEAHRTAEMWRAGMVGRFERNEVNLTKIEEAECVIGMAADWLQLDSPDLWVRHDSELALRQELVHASYLGMQTVILPPPRNRDHVVDYARAVNGILRGTAVSQYTHLSIRLPIFMPSVPIVPASSIPVSGSLRLINGAASSPASMMSFASADVAPLSDEELNATWEMWDTIRSICGYHPRLSLTLDLTAQLRSNMPNLSRWSAEPMRYIFLPASSFVSNSRGYPVLPKSAQDFIKEMTQHRPTIILANTQAGVHSSGGASAYPQYVRHLEKSSDFAKALEAPMSPQSFAQGYQDYLQAPLQPLMDNLQSTTYETFERDPVKYERYEEAVYRALIDRPMDSRTVICVAGSGRGGIVDRCLTAIGRSGRDAHVYALEKNPNACITLEERKENEWGNDVTLVFGDMRVVDVPEPVDILVSELLGSFGDNELSPECLDGAMRFLKPDGISIPSSYSAFLAPLSSSKLWNEACNSKDRKSAETPYVVMFQAVNILSGSDGGISGSCGSRIQECWEFVHPHSSPDTEDDSDTLVLDSRGLPITNTHNVRSAHLVFHIPHAGVVHGLAGYFEAVLYEDVGISIHPERMDEISKDMLSWFPIFFPFKEPIYLPSNSELEVSMWRLTDTRKVWYEWCAEAFLPAALFGFPGAGTGPGLYPPSSPFGGEGPGGEVDTPGISSRVKIGMTSLHNAGGESSWVGL
ncbi:PRMT5-domain-containing protein [Clavulina sp. PMI_390]|nr:PRMT5-domain-containing protein [Clavulina sp. PMI_390]